MQRACSELERKQVINTQRGVGSFVTQDESVIANLKSEMSSAIVNDFIHGLRHLGYQDNDILTIIKKALEK
jgi:DNA-binding transcriptional regulator YhcF (GntR family)